MLKTLFTAAVLAALFAPAALAQEGFRSPSGNIHCQFFAAGGGADATIRCDLRQMSNRPPPRPRDCDLEWGQAFEISARAARGTRLCYGDTAQDNRLPVLPYGRSFAARRAYLHVGAGRRHLPQRRRPWVHALARRRKACFRAARYYCALSLQGRGLRGIAAQRMGEGL